MFEHIPEMKVIRVFREHIVALIESINSPMLSAMNRPLEPAKAYIVGVRNKSGNFSIFVYLHLLQSNECLIYLHRPPEVSMDKYHDTEVEAIQFAETMGFMVDNMNFRNMTPDQKAAVMESLPLFHDDLAEFARRQAAAAGEDDVIIEAGEEDVVEDAVEVVEEPKAPALDIRKSQGVPREGVARLVRLFSSF